jgi:hypothetical protein
MGRASRSFCVIAHGFETGVFRHRSGLVGKGTHPGAGEPRPVDLGLTDVV